MVNAIIFDLDGTLADTMDDLMTAINKMLVTLGYDTRTKAELIRFINRGTRAFVRQSLPLEVQDVEFIVDSGIEIYKEEYEKCYLERTEAFDGMKEALEGLKERGIRLAVLSNKPDKFVKDICSKLFGKKLFKVVMGQSDLPTKPDPTSAVLISRLLGAKPSKCIMVGDSDIDVKTAQNAGMEFVGVSWGYRSERVLSDAGAKYIVEDTEGLISTIEEIVKRVNAKKKRFSKSKRIESSLKEENEEITAEEMLTKEELEKELTVSEIESK
ncbi:MAG: HAD family hydrolase [Clostridia bacterium]|nr:HAD family hydrolase [Clostridia bacterium]